MAKWDKVQHGNPATYRSTYYACRCDECRTANTILARKERQDRHRKGLEEGDERHGTPAGYRSWGCRCDACALAGSIKNKQLHQERLRKKENGGS